MADDEENQYDAHERFARATTDAWLKHQGETCAIGYEIAPDMRRGFLDFFRGWGSLPQSAEGEEYGHGRLLAERLAYAQGALASLKHGADEVDCPYAQFSAAWEVWCDGYNDEACAIYLGDGPPGVDGAKEEVENG